jgi:hypothetical protein
MAYLGTSSLQFGSYSYWSNIDPMASGKCNITTMDVYVGTPFGLKRTITLDLTPAISAGYNIGFCDIISLDNLRHRSLSCGNTQDFYIDAKFIDGITPVTITINGTSDYLIANCSTSATELNLCKNIPVLDLDEDNECEAYLMQTAEDNALAAYIQYLIDAKNMVTAALKSKCMSAVNTEVFDMVYWDKEYHFTLYYYDQSGGLVKTVPPAGVKPFTCLVSLRCCSKLSLLYEA